MSERTEEAMKRLAKFVEVMQRKFVGNRHIDSFYGIETGGPDEAECRVSDIALLLEEARRGR